ncbi:MAG: DUF924 domain-containing protein [Nitrococcus sp.]|nr:DUF924 domain-containing protein [Nitrococcus sp.]
MDEAAGEILAFWFGPAAGDAAVAKRQGKLWWSKNARLDATIRDRFAATHQRAARGEIDHWAGTPTGRLALVIVLDQLSRVLYRGGADAFAQDERALALALEAQERGEDRYLRLIERVFLYMPLEHSESLALQQQCVRRFEALLAELAPGEDRAPFKKLLGYARRHRDIIARFGRFPHRNRALGRKSTAAELEFLRQRGSSF